MGKDIFGSDIKASKSWSLDGAIVQINGGTELLVQSVSINYSRQTNAVKPINQDKKYIIAGEGFGTVQLSVIVGPKDRLKTFVQDYSNPCNIAENVLTIKAAPREECDEEDTPEDEGDNSTTFIASNCLMNSLQISVSGGSQGPAMINGTIAIEIGGLSLD